MTDRCRGCGCHHQIGVAGALEGYCSPGCAARDKQSALEVEANMTAESRGAANATQVGGGHYQKQKIQHWDYVAANGLDYFQGQVTKYVSRWKDKNGLEDLRKAEHFLKKYIELVEAGTVSKS